MREYKTIMDNKQFMAVYINKETGRSHVSFHTSQQSAHDSLERSMTASYGYGYISQIIQKYTNILVKTGK